MSKALTNMSRESFYVGKLASCIKHAQDSNTLHLLQMRSKPEFMDLVGLVSGPGHATDMQAYLQRVVDQFAELEQGITVLDCSENKEISLRARIFVVVSDGPGAREVLCQCAAGQKVLIL